MPSSGTAVAVLGAGSWGTALAALIARHGHRTVLWGRDAATIAAIEGRGENPRYLPGIPLPGSLRATTALPEALADADLVQAGGFPPFYLQPINFEGLYAETLRQRQQQAEGASLADSEPAGNA